MIAESPFNVALVEARIECGLSCRQAADRTGFTLGFIMSYEECAKNPTMATMWRFARAYGLGVSITRNGVTIESESGAVLLRDWAPRQ